jgi:hypothetical protein
MKFMTMFTTAALIGTSTTVLAAKPKPEPAVHYDECLPKCDINLYGTPWHQAYVRTTPCNNKPPIGTLYQDDVVYDLGTNKFGCSYWYTSVWIPKLKRTGWVASQFLDCAGNNPVPAAALAAEAEPATTAQVY